MPYPTHLHNGRCFPDEVIACPRQGKQVVEIIILKSEIIHDIEAGIRQIEKQRGAEQPQLLAEDGADNYLLCRYIDHALNKAVARCQAYLLLPSPFVRRISTDHTREWEEKNIFLAMPMNWPPHCIDALRDDVHSFIVHCAMQLFLAYADIKASEQCGIMTQSCWDDMNAQLNARLGTTNIHPTFLG